MKKILLIVVVVLLLAAGVAWYFAGRSGSNDVTIKPPVEGEVKIPASSTPALSAEAGAVSVIGQSVEGRDLKAYNFGSGEKKILFVGGIHGGYEWNTALLGYELIDYFRAYPTAVPANLMVTVIPVLNPDGLNKIVPGAGVFKASDIKASLEEQAAARFNARTVDLNRNFDCDWQTKGKWQTKTVSGGDSAFSEPESLAMKNFIENLKPSAVIVWYSAAGGVFSSNCHSGILSETNVLTQTYGQASGYRPFETFNYYEITGDMVNWLAKIKIPAISVLLTNHTDTEWTKNLAGVKAVLERYAR